MKSSLVLSLVTIALVAVMTGCGKGNDNAPLLSKDEAQRLETMKQQAESLGEKAVGEPAKAAVKPLAICSIGIAYITSAKNRFGSANPEFDNHTPLKASQIDAFLTDGRSCANLRCPKGGSYTIGSLADDPSCSKCSP